VRYPQNYHAFRLELSMAVLDIDRDAGKQGPLWKLAARLADLDHHLPAEIELVWTDLVGRVESAPKAWKDFRRVDSVFGDFVPDICQALGAIIEQALGVSGGRREELATEVVTTFLLLARRGRFG